MSYRLINANILVDKYPEVNEMPCIYVDLPNEMNGEHYVLEQEPKTEWIPVSERLPNIKNQTERYLVTLKNGTTVCDAMFTECEGEHWWNYNDDDVMAWMSLPKPYKESEE